MVQRACVCLHAASTRRPSTRAPSSLYGCHTHRGERPLLQHAQRRLEVKARKRRRAVQPTCAPTRARRLEVQRERERVWTNTQRGTNTGQAQPTARTVTGDQCPSGTATRPGERSPPHTPSLAGWAGGDMQRGGFGRSSPNDGDAPNVQLASGSRAAATTPAERRVHVAWGERAMRTASGRRAGAHLHVRSAAALVARGAHAARPGGEPARAS